MAFCTVQNIISLIIAKTIIIVITILLVLFFYNYPYFARTRVIDALVFKNGTDAMKRFETTDDLKNLRMSFYLYNITNPNEVINNGAKFKLQELGPFVYSEFKNRNFIDNNQTSGFITYQLYRHFKYSPELSNKDYPDPANVKITWINIPLIAATTVIDGKLESYPKIRQDIYKIFSLGAKTTGELPFIVASVQDFLFNGTERPLFEFLWNNSLFRFLRDEFHFLDPWPLQDNKFALLYNRNNSWSPRMDRNLTVSAGFGINQTYHDLNQYVLFNGSPNISTWLTQPKQCNRIGGTDGEFFSPFLEKSDKIEVLPLDICRRLQMKFKAEESMFGVPTSHYVLDEKTLESGLTNTENSCYCLDGFDSKECALNGLINLKNCNNQTGIYASGAHFWGAGSDTEKLVKQVDGLTFPNADVHEPMFQIEMNTGLALRARFPLQFNVKLKKSGMNMFKFLTNEDPIFLPFAWVSEDSEMTEDQSKLLKKELLILDTWLITTVLGGTIILITAIIVVSVILCIRYRSTSENTEIDRLISQ